MPEGYMEKALLKLARQLNAYDEASLTELWNKYEEQVSQFEPTAKWEEAAVALGMIQAVRLKNQLFNHNWAKECGPDAKVDRPVFTTVESNKKDKSDGSESDVKRSKVLRFRPRDDS